MPECPATITPDTKVGELLERWPALERVLLELSPHFAALRNPVLRRTLAKVATVRQAASVSGVPLGTLLERLREGAGLGGAADPGAPGADAAPGPAPAWVTGAAPARTHDARAEIEGGGHPLQQVMRDLAALGPGEVYALVTPFLPAPLVDMAAAKGFEAYSERPSPEVVRTWFRRRQGP